jgi:hypothetical protein
MSMTTTAHTPGCTGSARSEGWQEGNIVEFYCDPTTLPKVQQEAAPVAAGTAAMHALAALENKNLELAERLL